MSKLRLKKISNERAGELEKEVNDFLKTDVQVYANPVVFWNQNKKKWYAIVWYVEIVIDDKRFI